MIVIGVDTHKRSYTLVALDAATGGVRGQLKVAATHDGTLQALRFAMELDTERVWAVEDCRHVPGRLERGLVASGDRVIRVAPGLTETSRRAVREAGKSDPIDATAIARAALREGIDALPVAHLDEPALEIRILTDYRDQIIAERVRLANRLRWHLVALAPDLEASLAPASLDHPQVRARVARRLARLPHGPQVRVAKLILKRIGQITLEERELRSELTALIEVHCPALLAEHGCGPITAAIIIGHTAGAKRFPTDARFARHAGVAPIPANSGNTQRHRLHRGGDRQLNRAIHDPHHRVLPRPHRPRNPGLPRAQTRRRQKQSRSHPLPQTPPHPTHLAPALCHPDPHTTTNSARPTTATAAVKTTRQPDHRHRSRSHALHSLNPQIATRT